LADISGQRHGSARERPIKVCHIISTTESIVWPVNQLTRLRDDYGYEVAAIVSGEQGPLVDYLRAANIPVYAADFDFPLIPSVRDTVTKSLALARLLRRERFDIVQTALWHSMLLGRFAAWLADVPVREVMHAGPYYIDGPIHRWIDGSTAWMETFVIGCCQSIVDSYRQLGVGKDRTELVYYSPDETRFDPARTNRSNIRAEYGWAEDTPLVAHVAWFYPRLPTTRWAPAITRGRDIKGREDLIRAAPYILREFPNAKILLIGTAFVWQAEPLIADMKALVKELGLEESVIFTGFLPSVNDVLLASDVAVQPSLSEGCGGTFEALLLERPTVGTRIGGIPDMVIDGKTGVLVNPADPEDLARGICELLRDPERARAMGKAGREHVLRTATIDKTVADLDRLYRQWLFRGGKRRTGYRRWVTRLRLPLLKLVAYYLNVRFQVIEDPYLKWQAGWRPWHIRPPIHVMWSATRSAMHSVRLVMQQVRPRLARMAAKIPVTATSRALVHAAMAPVHAATARGRAVVASVFAAVASVFAVVAAAFAVVASVVALVGRLCGLGATWCDRLRRGEARLDRATARLIVLDLIAIQPLTLRTFIYESIAEYRRRTPRGIRDLKPGP
jgi:glycosyltransferase involved in cell wall biosynthesis